jgi:hypothetical protein
MRSWAALPPNVTGTQILAQGPVQLIMPVRSWFGL